MEKPTIFLDIDGVMAVRSQNFSRVAVDALNELTDKTGAEIVISSDWRYFYKLSELKEKFKDEGITGQVVDCTDLSGDSETPGIRVTEINSYIEKHDITKYVIIDDIDFGFLSNFIKTNPMKGLNPTLAKEAECFLI